MAVEQFKAGPGGAFLHENGRIVGHVSFGGDMLLMPVGKRTVLFEMDRYFGPVPLCKRTEDPAMRVPKGFYDAYELWEAGGRMVDGDLCVLPEEL